MHGLQPFCSDRMHWVTAVTEDLYRSLTTFLPCSEVVMVSAFNRLTSLKSTIPISVSPGWPKEPAKWLDMNAIRTPERAQRTEVTGLCHLLHHAPYRRHHTRNLPLDRPVASSLVLKGRDLDEARAGRLFRAHPHVWIYRELQHLRSSSLDLAIRHQRVRPASDLPWRVPSSDHPRILGDWASRTVKDADGLLQRLRSGIDPHAPGEQTQEPSHS